jgi:hypothetical protein
MVRPAKFSTAPQRDWATLDVFEVDGKFVLEERQKRDLARHIAEMALCFIVVILLFGSILLFVLPELLFFVTHPGVSLSASLVGIAVVVYALATRGFKPQVGFDKAKKHIWVCKLNSSGQARIVTYFPIDDVSSVFVKRPEFPSREALLLARVKGRSRSVTLLRGDIDDIEAAHHELCNVIRSVDKVRPVGPVRKVKLRRVSTAN